MNGKSSNSAHEVLLECDHTVTVVHISSLLHAVLLTKINPL